ncbi:NAD-dependent epimerase/dehydratase family protein [Microbacterium sp. zg-Y818]|uniref:NAD-dependent epimerase/dehydratase family protein n=1 Tax=unclassified Microbacterium TaxID=2609290 RepID=UPI00214C2A2B|nr:MULTISPECIES: NAD-dependent epimerase/dehydratase family protein [unclassified Microbacterium]MCR2801722.1 NAD-dependent epimerase/dehydratase family protein [Microbacterium sp. zg.Y818]WIM23011.1 NAD-dependent epimerase/dehydratase family protein [Microbacterium sp. zg-Y818]
MANTRWIIGHGLLGRAVNRVGSEPALLADVRWHDVDLAAADLATGLRRATAIGSPLEIYWCAGRGVTSTPASQLDDEVAVFARFLRSVGDLDPTTRGRLTFFLASSVGGAFAGTPHPPYTERSPVSPLSDYGRAKLRMEGLLEEATTEGNWRTFIARITNLYGPGQNAGKAQGLISVLADGQVSRRPVSVYVPLDTLRDYIYEDDAARVIDAAMRRTWDLAPGQTVMKLVGNMRAVSIGAILGEIVRLRRHRGAIVLGQGDSTGQASDLRVRSIVWEDLDDLVRTTLPEGIDQVFRAALARRAHGV